MRKEDMNEKDFSWTAYFVALTWGFVIGFVIGALLV